MQIKHEFSKSDLDNWTYTNNHSKEVSFPSKEKLAEYLEGVKTDLQVLLDKLNK